MKLRHIRTAILLALLMVSTWLLPGWFIDALQWALLVLYMVAFSELFVMVNAHTKLIDLNDKRIRLLSRMPERSVLDDAVEEVVACDEDGGPPSPHVRRKYKNA